MKKARTQIKNEKDEKMILQRKKPNKRLIMDGKAHYNRTNKKVAREKVERFAAKSLIRE